MEKQNNLTTEARKDILLRAFHYLCSESKIKTQTELADEIGASRQTVSKAINGDEKYCTLSLLERIYKRYSDIFSRDWLLYGEGDMLIKRKGITIDITNIPGKVLNSNINSNNNRGNNNHNHSTNNNNTANNTENSRIQRLRTELDMTKGNLKKAEEEIERLRNELTEQKEENKTLNAEYRKLVNKLISM